MTVLKSVWSWLTDFPTHHFIAIGAFCFGIVIGWMVFRTFKSQVKPDIKTLGLIIAVIAGTGTLSIFRVFSGSQPLANGVWAYPMGLLAGIVLTATADFVFATGLSDDEEKRLRKKETKDVIVQYLQREASRSISAERLRANVGPPSWTDRYLKSVVRSHSNEIISTLSDKNELLIHLVE